MKKISLFISLAFFIGKLNAQDFNMQFRSHVTYPGYTCSSEWGYVDALGNEYALVGTSFGVSIVDITDPDNPVVKFDVQHTPSFWREIKTYKNYAYATNEDGGGLLIMDLSQLPDTVYQSSFIYDDGNGGQQNDGHELWIDDKGRLYIIGGAYWNAGTTIFDLTTDPLHPAYLGAYENHYMHSAFVRGDTMWASEIFDGQVEVVNVANPAAPVLMASFHTPNNFTHNAWPTHDDHYLFTTDEVGGAFVASYDVSDLSNITELDRVQSFPGTDVIPHNVHLLNDEFAVTAYYCDGVVVFDVSRPKNMIKVASYDTWLSACNGYNGTWGAYPYLPSGNLILSNIEDGLYVLTPTYVPACWLEGIVTDSITGTLLNNVSVEILNTDQNTLSNLSGEYKTGMGVPANYSVKFSVAGYSSRIFNVNLSSGVLTTLNVKMTMPTIVTLSGTVIDSVTGFVIPNAGVHFVDGLNEYAATADALGNFSISNFFTSTYDCYAGAWGHKTSKTSLFINPSLPSITLKVNAGYYDDFIFDEGWTTSGDATTGKWTRGEPIGTTIGINQVNPDLDAADDFLNQCFVTGNGGGTPTNDDVDGGYTQLTSPSFNLMNFEDPKISYEFWFANFGASGIKDSMFVYLSNGITTAKIQTITALSDSTSKWNKNEINVSDFLSPTSTMNFSALIQDHSPENTLEGGIDKFEVKGNYLPTALNDVKAINTVMLVFPNPFSSHTAVRYDLSTMNAANYSLDVFDLVGRKINSFSLSQSKGVVNFGDELENGIYFLKLIADGKVVDQLKAVKMK